MTKYTGRNFEPTRSFTAGNEQRNYYNRRPLMPSQGSMHLNGDLSVNYFQKMARSITQADSQQGGHYQIQGHSV